MAGPYSHRGEMPQDSLMPSVHPTKVRGRHASNPNGLRSSIDPAARDGKRVYNALNASSVGLELGVSVGLGLLIGFFLDKRLGTTPWMLLLWMVIGLVAGFRGVFRAVARADRAAEAEDKEAGRG
jgi:ATP synthase protein I